MKILFLDVDSVLNVIPEGHDEFGGIFHKHFVDNLRKVVGVTGCKIVLSSSWRQNGLDWVRAMWKFRNYPGEVIDVTPTLRLMKGGCIRFWNDKLDRHPTEAIGGYSIPRGCEIEYWLQHEAERFGEIESFCIVDDDGDFLFNQRNNYIQTYLNHSHPDKVDFSYGLTDICTEKIINILNDVKPFV